MIGRSQQEPLKPNVFFSPIPSMFHKFFHFSIYYYIHSSSWGPTYGMYSAVKILHRDVEGTIVRLLHLYIHLQQHVVSRVYTAWPVYDPV